MTAIGHANASSTASNRDVYLRAHSCVSPLSGTCLQAFDDFESDRLAFEDVRTVGLVTMTLGGLATAGGALWYLLLPKSSDARSGALRLRLLPSQATLGLAVDGVF